MELEFHAPSAVHELLILPICIALVALHVGRRLSHYGKVVLSIHLRAF